MAFLSNQELLKLGFKYVGENVKISSLASIHNPEDIEIGDNSRVDDFCVLSGKLRIGKYVHIAVHCTLAGGSEGISFDDFSGLAYGCHVFSQSDDYTGKTMTNPTVPVEYKNEYKKAILIGKHVIVGCGSVIFPGVKLEEGSAIGAMTMVTKSTKEWSIYFGIPAKLIKKRSKELLNQEIKFKETKGCLI